MRSRIFLVTAMLAVLAALTAVASAAAQRPVKVSCTTTFTIGFDAAAQLPAADIVGTCRFTHLGLTRYEAHELLYPDGTLVNDATYTAANGDRLFAHATGTGVPTGPATLALQFGEWYTGGTGRFADVVASPLDGAPSVTGVGAVDLASFTGWFTSAGAIGY